MSSTLPAGPMAASQSPPSGRSSSVSHNLGDRAWGTIIGAFGGTVLLVGGVILWSLADLALPAAGSLGVGRFLVGSEWDPIAEHFGALPFIYGTVVTSVLAIALAMPIGVALALFISDMAPPRFRAWISFPVETLASIPSVVFGLWGLFVLVPVLRGHVQPFLAKTLGFLPLFQGPPIGLGLMAGGVILGIMILPTIASVTLEVLKTVPLALREGALALGATRWEVIRMVVLPYSRAGILGAGLLGLGRALGETMAVTMVIGNSPEIRASLFSAGYSLPAVIANEFAEATGAIHMGALAGLGLVLFGTTLVLNSLARLLMRAVGGATRVAV